MGAGRNPRDTLFYAEKYSQVKFQHAITGMLLLMTTDRSPIQTRHLWQFHLLTRQTPVKVGKLIMQK